MKNRKLFPTPNPTNGTECSNFCESDPFADFYYPQAPPPPPSLPLPSPLAVPDQADQTHGVSPSVIVLITLLGSFSLLVGYYVVVSKSCFGLCRRRRSNNTDFSQSDGGDEEELVEDNRAVDHPIWFITTVGLQQSIINSITVVKYKRNEGLIEGTDCSVCLNEFREDDTLRLLPKCSHAFHIPCIDTWLRSHTNCPLCRAHIVNESNTHRRLEPLNQNGGGDGIEEAQLGNNSENGTGRRVDQYVNGNNSNNNNSNGSCVLEGGNDNGEMVGCDQVRLVRSVSMDSSSSSSVIAKKIRELEENDVFGRSNREGGQKPQSLRMSPVVMKRSLSCGGRFLSSRPNQRLNSLLLPL